MKKEVKKILYLQIIGLLLFITFLTNQKLSFFSHEYETAIVAGILACVLFSIGKLIRTIKSE